MGSKHKNMGHKRYGASRPYQTRPTLPVVTVVCDDTKTSVAYFTELKREVKAKVTVNVVPAPRCGASPDDVIKHAVGVVESIDPTQADDSTWILLDMEAERYKQDQAQQAKKQAAENKVTVLLSNPCFEVWTLAHLVDTGEAFNDCAAVVTRVKAEWKKKFGDGFGKKKGQADYAKLMTFRNEAVRNANKRNSNRDGSWTEVFQVVEAIMSLFTGT
jgi:hypothetical protein